MDVLDKGEQESRLHSKRAYKQGLTAAISCAVLWGVLPIYWRSIDAVDSGLIMLYRVFLVAVCCGAVALKVYGIKGIVEPLKTRGVKLRYFIAGLLITANWSIFIWAVNSGHVIQTSIGYYMEPLVVALLGVVIFKEKMNKLKKTAVALALCAVIVILIHFGKLPLVAIGLALTFASYAAVKKKYVMPPALSLLYETMFLAPFALIGIVYLELNGAGALSMVETGYQYGLLLMCGIVTAIPMGLFAYAANRISLITLGITEYISPTLTLIIGIFVFKEPFDLVQLFAFIIIWIGLVFFTVGEVRDNI